MERAELMGHKNSKDKMIHKVEISISGCWEWQGSLSKSGYGKSSYLNKSWRSHRLMFFFEYGYEPKMVLHECDNRRCINPDHLYAGDHHKNMADMVVRKRSCKPQGVKHPQSKFKDSDILEMRSLYDDGSGIDYLSSKFKTHREYVRQIVQRKRWKHI